jgi:hypothetical protein
VTISFTAPVVVTKTPGSPRPLLQGSPDEIATDLRQYQALGVDGFSEFGLAAAIMSERQ